ncbi:hypothetical protein C8F04DRAFT_1060537 [Mycena alexandri]|uniref:Uncharacterized protein n=1 Tax=Mycena alexandri TaxID=1745969 RepID=A0AAD6XD21_9AGAR|nr:hypothetical protein C8F04DRAFT_1060537 [Mycena alexandri]
MLSRHPNFKRETMGNQFLDSKQLALQRLMPIKAGTGFSKVIRSAFSLGCHGYVPHTCEHANLHQFSNIYKGGGGSVQWASVNFPVMLSFHPLLILVGAAFVQSQTLYRIAPTDTLPATGLWEEELVSTTAISVVGVGGDGMTTYVQQEFVTAIAYSQGGSIFSVTPTTRVNAFTFEEDASRLQLGASTGGDIHAACTWGANDNGACVEVVPDLTDTFISTVTGSAVPWTTLKVNAAATPSSSSPTSLPSTPAPNRARASSMQFTPLVTMSLAVLFHALLSLS